MTKHLILAESRMSIWYTDRMKNTLSSVLTTLPLVQFWVTIAMLLVITFWRPSRLKRWIVILIGTQLFFWLAEEYLSYLINHTDSVQKYFLPPYSNAFFKVALRSFTWQGSGWAAAITLGYILYLLFLRHGRAQFLDQRDVWLLILGAVSVGWPTVLIFLGLVFALSVLGMVGLILVKKRNLNDRLIITPFILPAAIITLFIGSYLLTVTHLYKIQF